jgi:hypothetical protein
MKEKVRTLSRRLQRIYRAYHAQGAFVQDMGIDHGSLDVGVAEEFLDGAGWFSPVPRLLAVRQCIPQASAAGGSAAPRRVDAFEE